MASAQEPPASTASPPKASQELVDKQQTTQEQQQQRRRRAGQERLASEPALHSPLPQSLDLAQMNVIITGSTSGIGLEAAKVGLWAGAAGL